MAQRWNVTEELWENTPVGDLDVLHVRPADHLVFLTVTGSIPNICTLFFPFHICGNRAVTFLFSAG